MNKFYFPLILVIAAFGVACNPDDKNDTPEDNTVNITEESLKGTWEGGVTADFAQGYPQNWRIEFDGKNYTTWHTHQTAGSINDDEQGLKTVGNKEKGTWEYSDGVLTLTPKQQWASYAITSLSPSKYSYYEYNTVTMEAVQWYETAQSLIESGIERDLEEGTDWYVKKWNVVSFTQTTLSVKINRDIFKLEKK